MRCNPTQRNRRLVIVLIVLLLILGAVAFSVPTVAETVGFTTVPAVFTGLSVVLVCAAVFFVVRYLLTGFVYQIRPREDLMGYAEEEWARTGDLGVLSPRHLDLVVSKSQGSRPPVTECVLGLDSLLEAVPIRRKGGTTKADVRSRYAKDSFVFYDYTLTFLWNEALELVFRDGGETVGVILEPDAAMTAYLRGLGGPKEDENE